MTNASDSHGLSEDETADQIAGALARLRGRRMPRPSWDGADGGDSRRDSGWGRGGPHRQHNGMHPHGHGGPPPWLAGTRLGGPARLRLLEVLAAASHPLSVGEIGEAVGVDQPRASRLVQQGVQTGLLRREADPDDARRTRVALTDAGSTIVRGFRGERREAIDTALDDFTDEERDELARLLIKLADAWPR